MAQDHLPVGAPGEEPRLPVQRSPEQGTLALRPAGTALDLFEEPKRDDDEIDLLAYWQILLKRRWLVLGIMASVLALALLFTLLSPAIYRATTTLQIDREAMQIVQVEGMAPREAANSGDFYQTQYELLQSRSLAERVVDSLNLANSPRLENVTSHSWLDRLRESMRPQTREEKEEALAAEAGDAGTGLREAAKV